MHHILLLVILAIISLHFAFAMPDTTNYEVIAPASYQGQEATIYQGVSPPYQDQQQQLNYQAVAPVDDTQANWNAINDIASRQTSNEFNYFKVQPGQGLSPYTTHQAPSFDQPPRPRSYWPIVTMRVYDAADKQAVSNASTSTHSSSSMFTLFSTIILFLILV